MVKVIGKEFVRPENHLVDIDIESGNSVLTQKTQERFVVRVSYILGPNKLCVVFIWPRDFLRNRYPKTSSDLPTKEESFLSSLRRFERLLGGPLNPQDVCLKTLHW